MKEDGRLEELVHQYRGIGLVVLCALMIAIGSLQMEKRTVETGSTEVAGEVSGEGKKAGEAVCRLSGSVLAGGKKPQAILTILKKYHKGLQLILEEEGEGQSAKWYIEWQE